MSSQQKSKKLLTSNNNLWWQCDNCAASIQHKDTDRHANDCPPNLANITYNFVRNSTLYGTLDVKTNDEIKNVDQKDDLVFLSQSAIKLTSLSIGQSALVKFENCAPLIKTVWPTVEKSLCSVLLTKNCLDLLSASVRINSNVSVEKFTADTNLCAAAQVVLVLLNRPKSLEIRSELYNRLHNVHCNKIYCVSNRISIMFYGKILKFQIKAIEPVKITQSNSELAPDISQLKIADKEHEFYRIDERTSWKLFRDESEYNKGKSNLLDLSRIAGLDEEINEIKELMRVCLDTHKNSSSNFKRCNAVLLYGNAGTGKTSIVKGLANESKVNIVNINAPDLYSGKTADEKASVEETISALFRNAIDRAPSIIILDEIDVLCPARTQQRLSESEKRILSTLLVELDHINENYAPVFILATTNKLDGTEPAFRRCGRFDREIEIPTPNPRARKSILLKLLEGVALEAFDEGHFDQIAGCTHGFVGGDLVALCSRADLIATRNGRNQLRFDDFKAALKLVRPSAMREVQIEVPNVKWSDIGGQEKLKLILKQSVEWPLKHPDSFLRLGITPPRGVLMYGPPGCSKTMIAKALATESGLNFLSIKGPELFSKWVGESERAVREVFRKARQVSPSIIFFDEIDALGGERSSNTNSGTNVQERVLAQLLTELDGVTALGDVTIVAATNRPDRIDKALLRPGRLDRIVYVPLPDHGTRKEIFKLKLSKMPTVLMDDDVEELVKLSQGFSGAEVNAVCHEAAMCALEESLDAQIVTKDHFKKVLMFMKPRTSPSLIKLYDDYSQIKI